MLMIDRQGTIDVIQPSGALKTDTLEEVQQTIEKSVNDGRPSILLDLRETLLLDSEALEFLLETDEQCARRGGSFALAVASELVSEILSITGLDRQLLVYDELSEAMGSFAR